MHRFTATLVSVFALLAACDSNSSNHESLPEVVGLIDAAGGEIEVTAGPLFGTKVEIPQGALTETTRVSISSAFSQVQPGFRILSHAVRVDPPDVALALPVTITLPYDSGPLVSEVVVLARTPDKIVQMTPSVVDDDAEIVQFKTVTFATFWVVERLFGVQTHEFLPLFPGNEWNFDSGLKITMELTSAEPNLGGTPVYKILFDGGAAQNLGVYVQRSTLLDTELHGEFANVGGNYQEVHEVVSFLPAKLTLNQELVEAYTTVGYEPYGATASTFAGTVIRNFFPTHPGPVRVPLGKWKDVLEVGAQTTLTRTDGTTRVISYVLTLARDAGPIAVEMFGAVHELESGTVLLQPIEAPEEE